MPTKTKPRFVTEPRNGREMPAHLITAIRQEFGRNCSGSMHWLVFDRKDGVAVAACFTRDEAHKVARDCAEDPRLARLLKLKAGLDSFRGTEA